MAVWWFGCGRSPGRRFYSGFGSSVRQLIALPPAAVPNPPQACLLTLPPSFKPKGEMHDGRGIVLQTHSN